MADPTEVLNELMMSEDLATTWWALVPNVRGAELASQAGMDHLTVTLSASEGYSLKNTKMSTTEALEELGNIRNLSSDCVLDAVISCCFGSPFETIAPTHVAQLVQVVRDLGIDQITLADTTGTASPARMNEVLDLTGVDVGIHLHDTRGTALTNAYAAFLAGVRRFDTSIGGLGGSPFAPGAGGNLATEDLVLLMEDLGVTTGVDLDQLLLASHWLADELHMLLPSRVSAAGRLDPRA
jgi:hydroxymethylglutaryl-CoA lyase